MNNVLIALERGTVKLEGVGIFITLAVLVATLTSQIIARLGLPFDLDWTEEVSRLGLIWLIALGAALATYRGEHFLVEFVLNAIDGVLKSALLTLIRLLTVVFAGAMAWLGWNSVLFNWNQIFPVLEIPVGVGYIAVTIGFGLMAWHALVGLITGRTPVIDDEQTIGTGAD